MLLLKKKKKRKAFDSIMEERVVNIRDMGTSGFYVSGFASTQKVCSNQPKQVGKHGIC